MFVLKYAVKDDLVKELVEQLQQLSLAFSTRQIDNLPAVTLQEGKKNITGETAIREYLHELSGELHYWYYCRC